MTSQLHITAVLVAIATLCAAPVGAQPKKEPIRLFNEASDLADKGQLGDAVAIWLLVQNDIPDKYKPVVQVNLGLAYKKMDRFPEAWHHLSIYLKAQPKDKDAARWLKDVEKKLKKTHARVTLTCQPDGARVLVQSEGSSQKYPCPLTWWFKPGKRPVRVMLDNHKPSLEMFEIKKAGQELSRTVILAPEHVYGHLVIEGDARAVQVFIDGMLEGKVPFRRKLKPGEYDVMVGPPGKIPWKKRITIVAGKTITEKPDVAFAVKAVVKKPDPVEKPVKHDPVVIARPGPGRSVEGPKWWYWGLIGGGAALLAGGGAMTVMAIGKDNDLADKYDKPGATDADVAAYEDDFDSEVRPLANTSYVLYGLGGAALAAGVTFLVLHFADRPDDTPMPIAVTPMPGGMALTTTWEF